MAVCVDGFRGVAFVIRRAYKRRGVSFRDVVMVGDDRVYTVRKEEVHTIKRKEYCGECGQIGCTHDGR